MLMSMPEMNGPYWIDTALDTIKNEYILISLCSLHADTFAFSF